MPNEVLLVNPRKRKKSRKKSKTRRRRKNPVARKSAVKRRAPKQSVSRRRRSNPAARFGVRGIMDRQIIPAAIGASGALVLDIGMGYLQNFMPVGNTMLLGPTRYLVKGAAAIGIGMVLEMVVRRNTANEMTKGALTVILHDAMKETTQQFAPNVPMGEYVSAYVNPCNYDNSLGYTSAAVPAGAPGYGGFESYAPVGEYLNNENGYS